MARVPEAIENPHAESHRVLGERFLGYFRDLQLVILLFTACVIVGMWTIAIVFIFTERETALEQTRVNAANLSVAIEERVFHFFATANSAMDLVQERFLRDGLKLDLDESSRRFPELASSIIQVGIIGKDGRLLRTSLDPHAEPIDLSGREHFRVSFNDPDRGLFVGKPVFGRVSHETMIPVTRALKAADGSVAGVILFSVNPNFLGSLHGKIDLGRTGIVALTGIDGFVRARFTERGGGRSQVEEGEHISNPMILTGAGTATEGAYERASPSDHLLRLVAWRRMDEYGLVVLAALGKAEALASANRHAVTIASLAAVLTFVIAGFSKLLADERIELHRSRTYLTLAQRVAGVGSVELDLRTGRVEWSDEVYRILGVDPLTPPSRGLIRGLVHPDDLPMIEEAASKAYSGLPEQVFEYRFVRSNGEVRFVSREAEIGMDRSGDPSTKIITIKDVTEAHEAAERQRRTAEELARSQRLLAQGQRIANMGSFVNDLRTGTVEWSDEMYRIYGVTRDNFVPTVDSIVERIHPEDRGNFSGTNIVPKPNQEVYISKQRVVRPDGTIRITRVKRETVVDEEGKPISVIGTMRDITKQDAGEKREKELERQLLHSQKLEALGTLAGGIAHDLNNTLVPILALSKLALHDVPESSPIHENLKTIALSGERARDLVKQILAFSRKEDIVKREVDLAELTREALRMLRAGIPATIQIIENIGEVPIFQGDSGQLHQVIVNLVTNAAQAIGERAGQIAVSLATAVPESGALGKDDEAAICLRIADTGCGMDAATLGHIFEPFFTTKGVGAGTGLGLSVVHGIITSHDGRIDVRSNPGEGTEFQVILPIADIENGARTEQAA